MKLRFSRPAATSSQWADWWVVAGLMSLACVLRLALRLSKGKTDFIEGGYTLYLEIARTFLSGGGLCLQAGVKCAMRMPLYSLVVAAFARVGWLYPGLVAFQALMGAALVWIAWRLGLELFDRRAGLLAAAFTAFNPYAVIHDTALQETVLLNTLMALGILLFVWSERTTSVAGYLTVGVTLALATLTTARVALMLPAIVLCVATGATSRIEGRARRAAYISLPILLIMGGWIARNERTVGAPILTGEAGQSLWVGNNRWTFEFLPSRSIDDAISASFDRLSGDDRTAFEALEGSEVARDRLEAGWGRAYMLKHPGPVAWNAFRKVFAAASGQLSPAQGGLQQLGYAIVFVPVHLLAAYGLWRSRESRGLHVPVYAMFVSFGVTTAMFWAHTSHKSYLDVFLFVYAASVVAAWHPAGSPVSVQSGERIECSLIRAAVTRNGLERT